MSINILVVDDDQSTLHVLGSLLRMEGHAVEMCPGPAQALEQLRLKSFDVLLTDHMMPGMTGLELTRCARKLHPEIHCIVLTGRARPAGAAHDPLIWLSKPFDMDVLLAAMSSKTASGGPVPAVGDALHAAASPAATREPVALHTDSARSAKQLDRQEERPLYPQRFTR
jgi:CheY-like chemotaxis protein